MYPEERVSQNSPQLWSSPTGLATQCNRSGPLLCSAGSEPVQCTLSAASDKGPRAATLRQTTLRLHCRAQLAQSTSKSLSQNIVGTQLRIKIVMHKQQVATTLMHSCQMHTHTWYPGSHLPGWTTNLLEKKTASVTHDRIRDRELA